LREVRFFLLGGSEDVGLEVLCWAVSVCDDTRLRGGVSFTVQK
jgi:hypothetical protein